MVLHRRQHSSEEELFLIGALADGSLPPGRRPEIQQRIAASPALTTAFQQQLRVVTAIRSMSPPTPQGLRVRLEAELHRSRERTTLVRRRAAASGLATAVAVAAAAMVLIGSEGEPAAPTLAEVAALSSTGQLERAPRADLQRPTLLRRKAASLPFPNLGDKFGWRAVGAREVRLDGRAAETVVYEKGGRRIAYTIVAGESLGLPPQGRSTVRDGTSFTAFRSNDGQAVTWLRRGRTCLLSGRDVSRAELIELASWTGKGTIPS